jgi:hypothetical protein
MRGIRLYTHPIYPTVSFEEQSGNAHGNSKCTSDANIVSLLASAQHRSRAQSTCNAHLFLCTSERCMRAGVGGRGEGSLVSQRTQLAINICETIATNIRPTEIQRQSVVRPYSLVMAFNSEWKALQLTAMLSSSTLRAYPTDTCCTAS